MLVGLAEIDTVVFDNELSPGQQYNLEKLLGRTAIDRTAVILDAPLVLDCVAVDLAARTAVKPHFSGRALATLKMPAGVMFCGVSHHSTPSLP